MGSRSTKVAPPPHVVAVASPVAPAEQKHAKGNNTTDSGEHGPCQDLEYQPAKRVVTLPQPCDDINLKSSTRTSTTSGRRYSEPVWAAAMATGINIIRLQHLAAFESFIAERDLMAIDVDDASVVAIVPAAEDTGKVEGPEMQCLTCCTQLPKENDPKYAKEVIKPCRRCDSAYCISCVKDMFLKACKDSTRMPPRCCTPLGLHHIKPHLTTQEISEYKSKYEEWSTPKPFYCPVLACSAFIPERLLPHQEELRQKKADSGVGLPTSTSFQCPKCEGKICIDCRQESHPDSLCADLDLGIDAETAALLKAWGYKRCPKCGQGLKRMYGCNHMECRCGAHFCWECMKSSENCGGGCDEVENCDSESEPDEPEPLHRLEDDTANEALAVNMSGSDAVGPNTDTQTNEPEAATVRPSSRPAARPRNLDGGPSYYWEGQDLDFGEEPTDDIQDPTWDCHHSFEPYTIPLAETISTPASALEMECVKCWCTIHPDIETRPETGAITNTPRNPSVRGPRGARVHVRGLAARTRRTRYVPPRGLARSDATIGTASHLIAQLPPNSPRPAEPQSGPMEGVEFQPAVDSGGLISAPNAESAKKTTLTTPKSNVFGYSATTYNVAQECFRCSVMVCEKCAALMLAQQEERQAKWDMEHNVEAQQDIEVPHNVDVQHDMNVHQGDGSTA
ncbi:hypothetical protein C7974DRAFT_176414 [Boeremia exigua]|uniref:uncharacterized protein n=1 Tax=Boeremia exigua TaxID=749465 RepID=UPI001E8ED99B|nr:uncharacterized protein C7974DRAFT_176414 [Boeremia exigua]KAH6633654.1 hypothetical protein C7974DRAFT_176414 [Boeremia exigua]